MKTLAHNRKGFTILVAMIITATLLLVSASVATIAVREAFLSDASVQSQYAFYAADTGIECGLYWDVKNTSGLSAFATSTGSTIHCNQDSSNPSNTWSVGGSSVSTLRMTFLPDPYCADVTVTKSSDGKTQIDSAGYNTCDPTNPRRVSRAVRVNY